MNSRVTAILLFALLISGGATWVVYRTVMNRSAQAPAAAPTEVVMAGRQLDTGTLVKAVNLKTGPWTGPMPAGMVTKKESLLGRGVIAPIYMGEAIMENR